MKIPIELRTDSYKIGGHWNMLPDDLEGVHSYDASRLGAEFKETTLFGVQYYLKEYFCGPVFNLNSIKIAEEVCRGHFGNDSAFNKKGWVELYEKTGGILPLSIRAVPEGTSVPVGDGNVLFNVESTIKEGRWVVGYYEPLLSKVWATSLVATLARECKKDLRFYLEKSSDDLSGLNFMLHGFGYRSCSSEEGSGILDMAALTSFYGTDTVISLLYAQNYYGADINNLAWSVPASEHQIMTADGKDGELGIIKSLLNKYPKGILSVVADSYDYYRFVRDYVCGILKNTILNRDGVFVIRPDSITPTHPNPESLVLWTVETLWEKIGGMINSKGYKVINKKFKVLWGDGIDKDGITKILDILVINGFSVEVMVFGKGGNYVQKGIYRDRQRSAFKASAMKRNGVWNGIIKDPLDKSKTSKSGRLKLIIDENGQYKTINDLNPLYNTCQDQLVEVFRDGELKIDYNFEEIRKRAAL